MHSYTHLTADNQEGIVVVTINRPEALNALNTAVFEDLAAIFSEKFYEEEEHIIGFILTGAGPKAFAAGADIKEFEGLTDEDGAQLSEAGQTVFFNIEDCPYPVIAAVNGFALGGGCELAMACHIRIAAANAKFGFPEVNLGLIPGYGGTQRLPQLVGKGRALELILTADTIDATEAHRIGLVNRLAPEGEAVAHATALLQKLGTKGPIALSNVIFAVNAGFDASEDGYQIENECFGDCCNTLDFVEGTTAFLEKRTPEFQGE